MTTKQNSVTAGEQGFKGLAWNDDLTIDILKGLKNEDLPRLADLVELNNFIDSFCSADATRDAAEVLKIRDISSAVFESKLRERLFGKGKGSVVTDLFSYADDALIEPLFITEIKVLLETVTNNPKLFAGE